MPEGVILTIAAVLAVSAPLTGWMAFRRDRPPVAWFVFGALSGPLALVVLLVAPPGSCPRCDAVVEGWPSSCTNCGRRFVGVVPITRSSRPPASFEEAPAAAPPAGAPSAGPPPLPAAAASTAAEPPSAAGASRPSGSGPGWLRRRRPEPWAVNTSADPWTAETIPETTPEPSSADVVRPFPRPVVVPPPATREPTGLWPRLAAQEARSAPPPPAGHADSPGREGSHEGLQMVASGIFTGGSVRLEIGLRYGICRDGPNLVILGPVDRTPNQVQAVLPIEEIDLLSIEDRVTVARAGARDRLAMAFISAAGLRGEDLEAALADVTASAGADVVDAAGTSAR